MNNILITGASGQLGLALKKNIPTKNNFNLFFLSKKKLSIVNSSKLEKFFIKNNINLLINCAAFTNVDESEINKKLSNNINNLSLIKISKLVKKYNIYLIHISTDYVFSSNTKKFFNESATPNPKNYYGTTKLNGEKNIIIIKPYAIIIRTSWLYSEFSKNFVKTIFNLIIKKKDIYLNNNSYGSPTNANDLAKFIYKVANYSKYKFFYKENYIFHFSNEGCVSRYNFTKKIALYAGIKSKINVIKSNPIQNEIRPKCSCLKSKNLNKISDFKYIKWDKSLLKCVKELKIKYAKQS